MGKLKMLWPYKYEDISTWKYIDVELYGSIKYGTALVKRWILNPDFKYKHLDPNYPT